MDKIHEGRAVKCIALVCQLPPQRPRNVSCRWQLGDEVSSRLRSLASCWPPGSAGGKKRLAELARELANERCRLDRLDDQVDAVRVAFDLSYRGLSTDQARMFRLTALNPGPDFSSDTAAALADTDDTSARRVLDELARAHLIEPGAVRGRWGVHDLIRDYTVEAARADEDPAAYEQARDRLLDHYLRQAKAGTKRLRPEVEADREDALSWFDAEWANLFAVARMAADTGRDTIARDLPVSLGRYLGMQRRFSDALQVDVIRRDAALRLGVGTVWPPRWTASGPI